MKGLLAKAPNDLNAILSTVLVEVDSLAAFAFESLSTERRETNLVKKIALRSLGVWASNPFMPSLELS